MAQASLLLGSGLVKFSFKEDVKKYTEDLADYYQSEIDSLADKVGTLLRRNQPQEGDAVKRQEDGGGKRHKREPTVLSKGWSRVGCLLVKTGDSSTDDTEVLFELLAEFRLKLSRTRESLRSLEDPAMLGVPEPASYTLCLRAGVPERLIVNSNQRREERFAFVSRFRTS